MTKVLLSSVDGKSYHTNSHTIWKPTLTIGDKFHIVRSNIEALEFDFGQQILWLSEQLRFCDVSAGAKDIHSASQQILNQIEHIKDESRNSEEVRNDLEHIRYRVRVLEENCDWSKPTDAMVNKVVQICQDENERLKRENESLRSIIKASRDKGDEGFEDNI